MVNHYDVVKIVENRIITSAESDLNWLKKVVENDGKSDTADITERAGYMAKIARANETRNNRTK